jgi:hypothetical protein
MRIATAIAMRRRAAEMALLDISLMAAAMRKRAATMAAAYPAMMKAPLAVMKRAICLVLNESNLFALQELATSVILQMMTSKIGPRCNFKFQMCYS